MVGKVKELEDQLRIITEERDQQIQALQKQISSLVFSFLFCTHSS